MADSSAGLARFVEQLVRRGVAPEADARRVADELTALAGAESLSEGHVDRLLHKYRQRFAGPNAIATVMRIGEELRRWQARGGEAPALPSSSWWPPAASHPPEPAAEPPSPVEPPATLFDLELDLALPKPEAPLEVSLAEPAAAAAPPELEPIELSSAPAEAPPPAVEEAGLEQFDLELGAAAFEEASSGRGEAPAPSTAPSSTQPVSFLPRTGVPSAAPSSVGSGRTLEPLAGPAERRTGRAWAGIVAAAVFALVLVVGLTRPSCLFRPRPADVSGRFRSEHLGIAVTLSNPWAYTPADDTEKDSGDWEKKTSVMFRGESPLRFESLLLLTTWQKDGGKSVSEEDARTLGASETLGATATQRECGKDGAGYKCRSIFHPANVLYNAFEYYFAVGNKVVYVRALYELRGESETDGQPGLPTAPTRVRTKGETEADAIVASIEAFGG